MGVRFGQQCRPLLRLAVAGIVVLAGGDLLADVLRREPITPVPPVEVLDQGKVELGRKMFHDARLSRSERVSCASCHELANGGGDHRARSPGADAGLLDFNSPSVFNAALNSRLNWRGNFRTLEEHNEAVLLDPRLMGARWPELTARLRADLGYRSAFASLYGSMPERVQVLDALATFQRSLLTPGARFDRYLRGERSAIGADEERGYQLFKGYGCVACHQGVNIGGNLFQKFGVFYNPLAERRTLAQSDLGRFTLTGEEGDRYVFRVPSLRNVAATAPYFHDGSVASLPEAVAIMARSQLGRDLPPGDIDLIVKFLATLTGVYQGQSLPTRSDDRIP